MKKLIIKILVAKFILLHNALANEIKDIKNLVFKFPIEQNFISKYQCITKSDKEKKSSSFIYEIGRNQMKMKANDIATLLIDFKTRTYSFEGYKLNKKDKNFLREQNFDEIVQTVLREYLDFNILKNNRKIELGKEIKFKNKKLFMGLNTDITHIPTNFAIYNGMHVLNSQYKAKISGFKYLNDNKKPTYIEGTIKGVVSNHLSNGFYSQSSVFYEIFSNGELTFRQFIKKDCNLMNKEVLHPSVKFKLQKIYEFRSPEKLKNLLKIHDQQTKLIASLNQKIKDLENQGNIKKDFVERNQIGSGFYVSKFRHIVTNHHVVNNCKNITVGNSISKQIPATIVASDKRNDLAVLQTLSMEMASEDTKSFIQNLSIEIVPIVSDGLIRAEDVMGGEEIFVAGYPLGNMVSDSMRLVPGLVNATKGYENDITQFETDASIKKGNSGGPIYDRRGNIVGVAVKRLNVSQSDNFNFAIKGTTVKQFLDSNGVITSLANRKLQISSTDIYKIASKQTVMVVCYRE